MRTSVMFHLFNSSNARSQMTIARSLCVAALMLLTAPGAVLAQVQPDPADEWRTKGWVGDLTFASVNSLVAGASAGIIQKLRNGSFRDGFARGALGGAIAYGGRRVAAEKFWGAGLIGRQVSAVGISISRNAADNERTFRAIWLPLGPVTVKVDNGDHFTVSARADLFASAWLLAAVFDERLEFDAGSSMSSGAPVFRAPDHRLRSGSHAAAGIAIGGVVVVGSHSDNLLDENILAHERVHVLQYDFAQLLWGDPLEELVGQYVPYVTLAQRHVRIGALLPLVAEGLLKATRIEGDGTLWEQEAYYLGDR
jgi:hypothetical protein